VALTCIRASVSNTSTFAVASSSSQDLQQRQQQHSVQTWKSHSADVQHHTAHCNDDTDHSHRIIKSERVASQHYVLTSENQHPHKACHTSHHPSAGTVSSSSKLKLEAAAAALQAIVDWRFSGPLEENSTKPWPGPAAASALQTAGIPPLAQLEAPALPFPPPASPPPPAPPGAISSGPDHSTASEYSPNGERFS